MQRDLIDSELYEERYRFKERRSNVRFFTVLLGILLVFLGLRTYWTSNFSGVGVDGASMNKTLYNGEQLIMRYSDGGKDANYGDVIVVHVEHYPEVREYNANRAEPYKLKYLIKRLIAKEGDAVKCTDGQLYIRYKGKTEFTKLNEPYAYYYSAAAKEQYDFATYEVGKGEIFFLGDNRCNSMDSRYREEQGSHLNGRLYKQTDIYGIVPQWAIDNQRILEKIFF